MSKAGPVQTIAGLLGHDASVISDFGVTGQSEGLTFDVVEQTIELGGVDQRSGGQRIVAAIHFCDDVVLDLRSTIRQGRHSAEERAKFRNPQQAQHETPLKWGDVPLVSVCWRSIMKERRNEKVKRNLTIHA
nr:hypothetical protein [Cohnella faecalis]